MCPSGWIISLHYRENTMSLTGTHAGASSPSLSSVTTQMDQTLTGHGHALNELGNAVELLEQRLAFFMHTMPPTNDKAQTTNTPMSSSQIIAHIDASSREIEANTARLHSILERLPT